VTHELRFLERLRQHAASLLHLPLSAIGLYAERETPRDQYALTLREPYPIVEAQLHRLGFVRNLVSSLKFRDYAMPPETSVASWVRYPDGGRSQATANSTSRCSSARTARRPTCMPTGSPRGSGTRFGTTGDRCRRRDGDRAHPRAV